MTQSPSASPLSIPVEVAAIDAEDQRIEYTADKEALDLLTKFAGLVAVSSFHVEGTLKSLGDLYEARLKLTANVTQTCVVTLDPVEALVGTEIHQFYDPSPPEIEDEAAVEVTLSPEEDDPPEYFEGDVIDLGGLVLEHFVLSLDPYPRKQGAEFDPKAAGVHSDKISPFDVLKKLK